MFRISRRGIYSILKGDLFMKGIIRDGCWKTVFEAILASHNF